MKLFAIAIGIVAIHGLFFFGYSLIVGESPYTGADSSSLETRLGCIGMLALTAWGGYLGIRQALTGKDWRS